MLFLEITAPAHAGLFHQALMHALAPGSRTHKTNSMLAQVYAAGGALIVSAAPENTGTAPLTLRRLEQPAGLPDLGLVLGPEAVEFISPGVVGAITASASATELSAPPRLAAMDMVLPEGATAQSLSLTTAAGALSFDLAPGLEVEALAEVLNSGAVVSGDGQSLRDLGLLAQVGGGALTLLARDGALPVSATLTTDQGSAAGVIVADAAAAAALAQQLQAIHVRQPQIQQHGVVLAEFQHRQCGLAVLGAVDDKTAAAQVATEQIAQGGMVFDDE